MVLLNANVKKFMQIEQTQQCHHLMVKQKYPDNKFTWKDVFMCYQLPELAQTWCK